MNTEAKYELIEKYLANELSTQEVVAFEKQLTQDPELRADLDLHRQVEATLKGEKVHQFRDALKKVDSEWQPKTTQEEGKIRQINFRQMIAIAASLLLFVVAYQFLFPKNISNENLFADNFEPYEMILNQRSETNSELFNNAISDYENKKFAEAATAFQNLRKESPEVISIQFYTAIAELSANNSDEAINILTDILNQPNHLFIEQSRWYLALAHLQKSNTSNAKSLLQEIKSSNFKYKNAQELLKKLK